jgi:hypothetical protein
MSRQLQGQAAGQDPYASTLAAAAPLSATPQLKQLQHSSALWLTTSGSVGAMGMTAATAMASKALLQRRLQRLGPGVGLPGNMHHLWLGSEVGWVASGRLLQI